MIKPPATREEIFNDELDDHYRDVWIRWQSTPPKTIFTMRSFESYDQAIRCYGEERDDKIVELVADREGITNDHADDIAIKASNGNVKARRILLEAIASVNPYEVVEELPEGLGLGLIADGVNANHGQTEGVPLGLKYLVYFTGKSMGENLARDGDVVKPIEIIAYERDGVFIIPHNSVVAKNGHFIKRNKSYVDTKRHGFIDKRVKSNAFVWIRRPLSKLKGSQQHTYEIIIDTDILDEYGLDYEFTENKDLIINENISDVLEIADMYKEVYIQ